MSSRMADSPSCLSSIGWGKFAGEEVAQHVGDRLAALEGRDLDPGTQRRRHIDGKPRGKEIAGARRRTRRLGRTDPGLCVAWARCEAAVGWARAHRITRSTSAGNATISRAA